MWLMLQEGWGNWDPPGFCGVHSNRAHRLGREASPEGGAAREKEEASLLLAHSAFAALLFLGAGGAFETQKPDCFEQNRRYWLTFSAGQNYFFTLFLFFNQDQVSQVEFGFWDCPLLV